MHRRHRLFAAAGALALCLSLAACSSSGSNGGSDASISEGSAPVAGGNTQDDAREVVTTANLTLVSAKPLDTADEVIAVAKDAGGRVDSRSESPALDSGSASAELTLRIPSDSLDEALEKIEESASVVSSRLQHEDVTDSARDLDARITALRTSVNRLLELMKSATDTSDLIEIEKALSDRQAELDSLVAQRDDLSSRVDLATVTVSISTPDSVPTAAPSNLWEALVLGVRSIGSFLGGIVIVFGVVLPWLVLAGAIALAVIYLRRFAKRRGTRSSTGEPRLVPDGPAEGPRTGRASYVPPAPPLPTQAPVPTDASRTAEDASPSEAVESEDDEEDEKR
ncbi:protein of unknown function [Paramicrobacterium humi]|uniref:DUF4349 domain-containing protein n=1 Tax=Paramicrobacterium humi TaxID=640635 RepID=A0A1H4P0P0_9MICO|nr:DUF4349 domain-containing protein [Microbacterium humi]SEC00452.1 protein of unknown function [Microbacterium humi]